MTKFIEVYLIPEAKYSGTTEGLKKNEYLRLINVDDISRIQYGQDEKFKDRAEIVLKHDGQRYYVVGTYEEIIDRITKSIADPNGIVRVGD